MEPEETPAPLPQKEVKVPTEELEDPISIKLPPPPEVKKLTPIDISEVRNKLVGSWDIKSSSGGKYIYFEGTPDLTRDFDKLIPNTPLVTTLEEINIQDTSGKVVKRSMTPKKAVIAHGINTSKGWKFLDGQDVKAFIIAYNTDHPNSKITNLIVCNAQPSYGDIRDEIKVSEFEDTDIIHAVGSDITLGMFESGIGYGVSATLANPNGVWFGV